MDKVLMEFDYMWENEVCTHVIVYIGGVVKATDYTNVIIKRAFGTWTDNVTFDKVQRLFEYRCMPSNRANIKELLDGRDFSAKWVVQNINHGVMASDKHWIRFSYEKDLTWEKVSEILRIRYEE